MTPTRALLLALALGSTPVSGIAQGTPHGPLTWEEGSTFQRIVLTPAFEGAEVSGRGTVTADLWVGYSNLFEQDATATHVLFRDAERLLTAVSVRVGLRDDLDLGGRLTLESSGGGILDGFVHGYHELLGFGQANRDRFPQDRYAQRLSDGTTLLLDVPRRAFDPEEAQLFAKWSAFRSADGRDALAVRATLRVPLAENTVGDERADAALVGLGRLGAGRWFLHGMLGAGVVRASPELERVLRDWTGFAGFAVERPLTRRLSAVAQLQLTSPLLRGFDHRELDWPAHNLVLGLAGAWGDGWSWDASFQEDLPADTPAIDFTVSLRVSRRWR